MATVLRSALLRVAAATCLVLPGVLPAQAQYTVVDLGVLPGGVSSIPFGINNLGDVVGRSQGSLSRAFLYTDAGGIVDLGTLPGATSAEARDINDLGHVTGESGARAFRLVPGSPMQNLGTLGGPPSQSFGYGINNLSQVVGETTATARVGNEPFFYDDATGMLALTPGFVGRTLDVNESGIAVGHSGTVAFVYTPGAGVRFLQTPAAWPLGFATAVNDLGQVAGAMLSANGNTTHLFLWSQGAGLQDLGLVPGGSVTGMNNHGVMVGIWQPGVGQVPYRRLPGGAIENLNNLVPSGSGWFLRTALGINERGQIICTGSRGGPSRALRLDPVAPSAAAVAVGRGCGAGSPPLLRSTLPVSGTTFTISLQGGAPNALGFWLLGIGRPAVRDFGSGCRLFVDTTLLQTLAFTTDPSGAGSRSIAIPNASFVGLPLTAQAAVLGTAGPLGLDASNAVLLAVGQ